MMVMLVLLVAVAVAVVCVDGVFAVVFDYAVGVVVVGKVDQAASSIQLHSCSLVCA